MTKKDKVTVEDIIGIVHTDEPTDSVEEVRKLRGRTNERFIVDDTGTLIDMETRDTFDYVSDVVGLLNGYDKENEQLKSKNRGLQSELQIFKEDVTHSNLQINKLADENEQLKSIKKFADRNGICIFNIDEAFRRCWNDNAKLVKENEQLRKDATTLVYSNQDYRKENEQLKADKQALIDFIRKEFPKSHKHILEGFE